MNLTKAEIEIILNWWTFCEHTGDAPEDEELDLATRLKEALAD